MRPLSIRWIYYALFKKKEPKKNILANTMYLQIISKYYVFADLYISKYYVFADDKQILRICRSFFIIFIFIFSFIIYIYSKLFFPGFLGNGQTAPLPRRSVAASRGQSLIFRFSEVSGIDVFGSLRASLSLRALWRLSKPTIEHPAWQLWSSPPAHSFYERTREKRQP